MSSESFAEQFLRVLQKDPKMRSDFVKLIGSQAAEGGQSGENGAVVDKVETTGVGEDVVEKKVENLVLRSGPEVQTSGGTARNARVVFGSETTDWSQSSFEGQSESGDSGAFVTGTYQPQAAPINFLADTTGDVGFYKSCVSTPNVKNLEKKLVKMGVHKFGNRLQELALCTYAAGVMPGGFIEGRARLKNASLVGDALLKYLMVDEMVHARNSASTVNNKVTSLASRKSLTTICVNSGLAGYISVPTGVDINTSDVAGEHLEALIGVIGDTHGLMGATLFLKNLGILDGSRIDAVGRSSTKTKK